MKSSILSIFKKPLGISYSFLNQTKQQIVSWFNTGELRRENLTLQAENRQLVSSNLKVAGLEKENEFLRKELGVAKRKNFQVAMGRVFHQQFNGQSQTTLIDVGDNEGIKPGMPVIFDGEVLYGVVKEVYPAGALVYLITDPRLLLSVKINNTEVMGQSRGALTDGISLDLVANQEEVEAGDLVLTSGLDGLPEDLVVGMIRTAQSGQGGLFQNITIEPQFEKFFVDRVFVLK